MNSNEILAAAVTLATDLYEQTDFTDPLGRTGHVLGLDWLLAYESHVPEIVTVRYWNTADPEKTVASEIHGNEVRNWASKNRIFCGVKQALPFKMMFVPDQSSGRVLFVPAYRNDQTWGAVGFGRSVAPVGPEREAMVGFGKLLLSVIRRQEKEQKLRKQIENYLPRLRSAVLAPVVANSQT